MFCTQKPQYLLQMFSHQWKPTQSIILPDLFHGIVIVIPVAAQALSLMEGSFNSK